MTICSLIEKEGKLSRSAGGFAREKVAGEAGGKSRTAGPEEDRLSKTTAMRSYLYQSGRSGPQPGRNAASKLRYFFGGLHFSQTLPSFLAFTQHLCSHSLPAAFAFSQHVSARTAAMLPSRNKEQRIALMDFIVLPFLPPTL